MKAKNGISFSRLTRTILAGRINKAGTMWIGEKTDVTNEAVGAVLELLKTKDGMVIVKTTEGKYRLIYEKLD
jgi:hypothetical protein